MPRFEVFLPAAPPRLPIDLTLRIDAEHWLGAMKAGLQRIGEAQMANNVLCDIREDGSIHVTEPVSGRTFRVLELPQPSVTAPPAPPPVAPAAVAAPAGRPPPLPTTPAAPLVSPRRAAAPRAPPPAPAPAPAPAAQPAGRIGRLPTPALDEDVLSDLFLEVAALQEIRGRTEGLEYVLDLAMRATGCEAGSVFLADLGGTDLSFAAVRGPSAAKLKALGLRIPVGVGLVGFCAQENVCLAVCDAEKDPRFYRAVSEAVGYATRSLLCAPVASGGRVLGALEVLNKGGGQPFGSKDLAVLSYLAAQTAAFLARRA